MLRTVLEWKVVMERMVLQPKEAVVAERGRCAPGRMMMTVVSEWTLVVANAFCAWANLKCLYPRVNVHCQWSSYFPCVSYVR